MNKKKKKKKTRAFVIELSYEELSLRFTRYAWEKIVHLNGLSHAEVGAFGISSKDDLLLVEDLVVIEQEVTGASVKFDDDAVADFFLDQYEAGRQPEQVGRIWIHTHPNWAIGVNERTPTPSPLDEDTFKDAFGNCDWSLMFIYGGGKRGYARLALRNGFSGEVLLPVTVEKKGRVPKFKDFEAWEKEFEENVTETQPKFTNLAGFGFNQFSRHAFNLPEREPVNLTVNKGFGAYLQEFNITTENFKALDEYSQKWWRDEYERDLARELSIDEF